MLTYSLKKQPGLPLYESLYQSIRRDILTGVLRPGEKLPSKRALSQNLEISKITVESAYSQLLDEGYIRSREKVGYFVEAVPQAPAPECPPAEAVPAAADPFLDLTANATDRFPFSVWSRLQRQVMLDYGEQLLKPLPNLGLFSLRQAISAHLAAFRGMTVDPRNILIGAGTDFLYNLLIQLLGREKVYAVEDPGYGKIRRIYHAGGIRCISAPMDASGVLPDGLGQAAVLHISPSHHFPTGIITPVSRRRELLHWASQGERYIIEDDYDSEFRFDSRPQPTMLSMDRKGQVIYINSFSKTLAPSIRISYMVLPSALMDRFQKQLGFYGCTVPSFEQYTLERFLTQGYFEKHLNRMRKLYRSRRNRLISALENCTIAPRLTILENNAGLHFLLKVDTRLSDDQLTARLLQAGIRARMLSHYFHGPVAPENQHCIVLNYSGIPEDRLPRLTEALSRIL